MDETAPPKWKRPRVDGPPDIALDVTSIAFVADLIRTNNAETKPKKRMTLPDLVNEAFVMSGRRDATSGAKWWDTDEAAETIMMEVILEGRLRHNLLPSASSLSRVLYDLHRRGRHEASKQLLDFLLDSKRNLPASFAKSVDEKVVAVGLRCLLAGNASQETKQAMLHQLMESVPTDAVRRRMYTPILDHCAATRDAALMQTTVRSGLEGGMEFWDSDYDLMLQSLKSDTEAQNAVVAEGLRVVLKGMEMHHPVVGARNAASLSALLGGREVVVPANGRCPKCERQLGSFDYNEDERQSMVSDIMVKLIHPRINAVSHYQPSTTVDAAVRQKRQAELASFLDSIASMDFNAVIDGANVGYYGLSHWYPRAKRSMLESKGLNVDKVSYGELHDVPFPVDVPPQFSTIDEIIGNVRRLGYRPIVVLHERHTIMAAAPPTNVPFLHKWAAEKVLLPSPAFLNDDYCWLLAAMARPACAVITNDLMRDHHFGMLSQRTFLRWRQRMRIPYKAFVLSDGTVKLNVYHPPLFSMWAQKDPSTGRWHIPFLKGKDVLDQATNKIRREGEVRDDLDKDGGDHCDAWICTEPFS
jgi:mitochondrial ribonuclease P protein 3